MGSPELPGGKDRRDKLEDAAARAPGAGPDAGPDLALWAKDWITLWQSELTAMAADRELREGWTQLMALWAGAASQAVEMGMRVARPPHDVSRSSGADGGGGHDGGAHDAARPAPGAAAPDAGGDAVEHLHRRIADLEARLRVIERGPG